MSTGGAGSIQRWGGGKRKRLENDGGRGFTSTCTRGGIFHFIIDECRCMNDKYITFSTRALYRNIETAAAAAAAAEAIRTSGFLSGATTCCCLNKDRYLLLKGRSSIRAGSTRPPLSFSISLSYSIKQRIVDVEWTRALAAAWKQSERERCSCCATLSKHGWSCLANSQEREREREKERGVRESRLLVLMAQRAQSERSHAWLDRRLNFFPHIDRPTDRPTDQSTSLSLSLGDFLAELAPSEFSCFPSSFSPCSNIITKQKIRQRPKVYSSAPLPKRRSFTADCTMHFIGIFHLIHLILIATPRSSLSRYYPVRTLWVSSINLIVYCQF